LAFYAENRKEMQEAPGHGSLARKEMPKTPAYRRANGKLITTANKVAGPRRAPAPVAGREQPGKTLSDQSGWRH
jgi:hypothetical protein